MTACNDCWDEAFIRSQARGGFQADIYRQLLNLPPAERPWCATAQALLKDGAQ